MLERVLAFNSIGLHLGSAVHSHTHTRTYIDNVYGILFARSFYIFGGGRLNNRNKRCYGHVRRTHTVAPRNFADFIPRGDHLYIIYIFIQHHCNISRVIVIYTSI